MNLGNVEGLLGQTLDVNRQTRKNAIAELEKLHNDPGFCLSVLQIIEKPSSEQSQHSASIYLKNYIKKGWDRDEANKEYEISDETRNVIKNNIVELMSKVPEKPMQQLTEAVRIIGVHEFPENWRNLLPAVKEKLQSSNDMKITLGLLETLNSLFKMFRDTEASDALWLKLKYVLEEMQQPVLELMTKVGATVADTNNVASSDVAQCMKVLCRIFFSLNWQTIPEYFEDNISVQMDVFHKLLGIDTQTEVKLLDVQTAVIDNLKLYAEKYEEEFEPFLSTFTQDVWNLLVSLSASGRNDSESGEALASIGLEFLSTIIRRQMNKPLFSSANVLESICEKVVVPQLLLREFDVESFSLTPLEYVRGELEGGEKISRRKNAVSFIRAASVNFQDEISSIGTKVIAQVIEVENPEKNLSKLMESLSSVDQFSMVVKQWDVCVSFFIAIASKGYTFAHGVSELSSKVSEAQIQQFFGALVKVILLSVENIFSKIKTSSEAEELSGWMNILLSSFLKFCIVFRRQLSVSDTSEIANAILSGGRKTFFIESDSFVLSCCACVWIDRIFMVKSSNGVDKPYQSELLAPYFEPTVTSLFSCIQKFLEEEEEYNEYAMKAIMRILLVTGDALVSSPHISSILQSLVQVLLKICESPKSPTFNHYLFESVAAIVGLSMRKANAEQKKERKTIFETNLFPIFEKIFAADVSELTPFVFQIMSQLLELSGDTEISQGYLQLFPVLLRPEMWKDKGVSPVLVRLLSAFLSKNAGTGALISTAAGDKTLLGLLGIFQQLMSITSTEASGLKLLSALTQFIDPALYQSHLVTVFEIIFTKFQKKKSTAIAKRQFIVFLAVLQTKLGAPAVISMFQKMSPLLFSNLIDQIILPVLPTISDSFEKKASVVYLGNFLIEMNSEYLSNSASVENKQRAKSVFAGILDLLSVSGSDVLQGGLRDMLDDLEETGFSSNYSKLQHSVGEDFDPFQSVPSAKEQARLLCSKMAQFMGKEAFESFAKDSLLLTKSSAKAEPVLISLVQ